jgi:hypothetical protein
VKAIETRYKGYRFRSRLEARWAVFFDREHLAWEYERQGYDLDGLAYLPDFWLPQVRMWAEVKAEAFTAVEVEKAFRLWAATGHQVLFLVGLPGPTFHMATAREHDDRHYCGVPAGCGPHCRRAYMDYHVSSYHDYPAGERRFFTCSGLVDTTTHLPASSDEFDGGTGSSVAAALSARFEHGETP